MPFCRECGVEIKEIAKFCPKCGNPRKTKVQKNEIPYLSFLKNKKQIIITGAIIILLILFIGYVNKISMILPQKSSMSRTSTTTILKQFVCNPPYINLGKKCCLDKNNDKLCDKDRSGIIQNTSTSTTIKVCDISPTLWTDPLLVYH